MPYANTEDRRTHSRQYTLAQYHARKTDPKFQKARREAARRYYLNNRASLIQRQKKFDTPSKRKAYYEANKTAILFQRKCWRSGIKISLKEARALTK